ncbi:MAG: winged helix-turn-helix domain-containing protein, partial [Acidimicrobiia bacterium]
AINVLERTQFLVPFSRMGAYDVGNVHRLTGPGGPLWEYWGHAASLLPVDTHPLLRWRIEQGGHYVHGPAVRARVEAWRADNAGYIAAVLDEVRDRGPLAASQLADPRRRDGEWWGRRSVGRQALEWLFDRGLVAAWRAPSFERVYDLPERVLPAEVLARPTPPADEAQRQLLLRAAGALGVATAADLGSYYLFQGRVAKARVPELVEAGSLVAVEVEGWREQAYVLPGTRPRRPVREQAAILSPFDSLVWNRDRNRRVFGFDYTIEVYVPAPKRVYGYYVLPVLLGDELVGRLDLKADRRASVLRVAASHLEAAASSRSGEVAAAVAAELDLMRAWLRLDTVEVAPVGNLAPALRRATRSRPAAG